MAKARRHSNPYRVSPSAHVHEQQLYDEAHGPRNLKYRETGEWREDPGFTAVDLRLSAQSQARENVREFNRLKADVANLGFNAIEMRELLKDLERATSDGGWMLSAAETHIDGHYRTAIRDAREWFVELLTGGTDEETLARDDGIAML